MMLETPQYAKGNLYQLSIADLRPDPDQPAAQGHRSGCAASHPQNLQRDVCTTQIFARKALNFSQNNMGSVPIC